MANFVASWTSSRRPAIARHVRGVEERHAEVQRPLDRGDRLVVVAGTVELGHAHAAEAEGGDGELRAAEGAHVHDSWCSELVRGECRSTTTGGT